MLAAEFDDKLGYDWSYSYMVKTDRAYLSDDTEFDLDEYNDMLSEKYDITADKAKFIDALITVASYDKKDTETLHLRFSIFVYDHKWYFDYLNYTLDGDLLYKASEEAEEDTIAVVRITVDGELYGEYPLGEDRKIEMRGDGWENTLVIKNGYADMAEADCPKKICVNTSPICNSGETIICLPHRVVVAVENSEGQDLDAIAG